MRELVASAGDLSAGQSQEAADLPPGTRPAHFLAGTTAGDPVSLDHLSGSRALIGFFFAGCTPCSRQLPAFVELAKTMPGGAGQVVAVLVGQPEKVAEYAAQLVGVASVVLESPRADEGTLARAFSVSSWPTYYLLDSAGRVESGVTSFSSLRVPAMAGKRQ